MQISTKIVTLLISMLWLNAAQAWDHRTPLFGVTGGFSQRTGHVDYGMVYQSIPNFPRNDFEIELVDQGGMGGIFAGYQVKCHNWIYGLEVKVDYEDRGEAHDYAVSDNGFGPPFTPIAGFTGIFSYHRSPILGISGRVGYHFSPEFIGYMRLGGATSRDHFEVTIQGSPALFPVGITLDDSHQINYIFLGFGAETPLFDTHFSLRFEYNYNFRGRALVVSGLMPNGTIDPFFEIQTHPKTHQLFASLVWNMC